MLPRLTPMGVCAASRGAWTGATIAMPGGLTGAVTNGAAPPEPLSRRRSPLGGFRSQDLTKGRQWGFLITCSKSVPQGRQPCEAAAAGSRRPTGVRRLNTKAVGAGHEFRFPARCWRTAWGIRWTARKAPAERPWRRGEIEGRQRAKSADLAWPPQFGARAVDHKGFGRKDWYVRIITDSATSQLYPASSTS